MKIKKEFRIEVLEGTKKAIKSSIVNLELDIRYIKRELLLASAAEVIELQRSLDNFVKMKDAYVSKLEVLADEIDDANKAK